jgi:hypothetical protein
MDKAAIAVGVGLAVWWLSNTLIGRVQCRYGRQNTKRMKPKIHRTVGFSRGTSFTFGTTWEPWSLWGRT